MICSNLLRTSWRVLECHHRLLDSMRNATGGCRSDLFRFIRLDMIVVELYPARAVWCSKRLFPLMEAFFVK